MTCRHNLSFMAITYRTRKILWIKAGGRCSVCRILLVTEGTDTDDPSVFGEEAHIVASARSGPRAGEVAEVDSYDNLILLCSKDHKRVDDQIGHYTVDRLKQIKQTHEEWVSTLGRTNVAETVAGQLLAEPLSSLPPSEPFPGTGLYALYYLGDFSAYAPIAPPASGPGEVPIYISRVNPPRTKTGVEGLLTPTIEPILYKRLCEHATTLDQTQNLLLQDFRCRYLVIDDIWIPLAETLMIQQYKPVWNQILQGFGNHDPGAGRYFTPRPEWDELHPGRSWAARQSPARHSAKEILTRIAAHFSAG
jgi:hypothetical protein